jgi:hypothetical protein
MKSLTVDSNFLLLGRNFIERIVELNNLNEVKLKASASRHTATHLYITPQKAMGFPNTDVCRSTQLPNLFVPGFFVGFPRLVVVRRHRSLLEKLPISPGCLLPMPLSKLWKGTYPPIKLVLLSTMDL